jgi:exopolysaccharide production protein ExoZ
MFKTLQFYRGIASLFVLFYHLSGTLALHKYFGESAYFLRTIFQSGGDIGVSFFFVLSGFIIHFKHRNDLSNSNLLLKYYYKRGVRIYLPYITIFLTVYFAFNIINYATIEQRIVLDIVTFIKSLILWPQNSVILGGTGAPVIIVAWSLQFEIFFYLIYGLGFIYKNLLYIIISIYFLFSASLLYYHSFTFPFNFLTSVNIMLFIFGIIVNEIYFKYKNYNFKYLKFNFYVSISFFLIIILLFPFLGDMFSIYFIKILLGFASSYLILCTVFYENYRSITKYEKLYLLLGDISYSLYLVHFPLISLMTKMFIYFSHYDNIVYLIFIFITEVIIAFYISFLFNKYYEKPLLKYFTYNFHKNH